MLPRQSPLFGRVVWGQRLGGRSVGVSFLSPRAPCPHLAMRFLTNRHKQWGSLVGSQMAQKFGNGRWVKEGFLDNRVDGTIVGQIVFAVVGPVDVYLRGNFKADIAGQVIQFRNRRFEDEDLAGQVIGDMENPQIGDVNLISFDPHPNLIPHPYIEWFSTRKNHYRIELEPADAWIVPASEMREIDRMSRTIHEALAGRVTERPTRESTDWV